MVTGPLAGEVFGSKVVVPVPPSWGIARPRVTDRLRKGARGPLTVITGPPGAGKTVAAISWAAAEELPVAWVTLQEGDGERPEVFWPLVVAALRRAGAEVSWRGALVEVALELSARTRPVVLVLDDLRLPCHSEVSRGLSRLLGQARPWLRLVATARRDPALPLHRYHLAGELTTITAGQLAFTECEAAHLLAQHQVRLQPASLRALLRCTEGWAAGLRLAAISMEGRRDPDAFAARFGGDDNAVVAYLAEEMLDALPAERRRLLLATSVPDRVNAELAAELAGREAGAGFAAMIRDNPFAARLDRGWYRYHPMVAEALRLVLRHERPGSTAALDRRAAAWFAGQGELLDAVRHAARAGDWPYAARLVVHRLAIGRLLGLRGDDALTDVMRGIRDAGDQVAAGAREPESEIVLAALACAEGDEETCTRSLAAATAMIERAPIPAEEAAGSPEAADPPPATPAAAPPVVRLAVRLVVLAAPWRGEPGWSVAVGEAEELVRRLAPEWIARSPEISALVCSARGQLELRNGRLDRAAEAFSKALTAAYQGDGNHLRRHCLGHLALTEGLRGRPAQAAEPAAEAARLPEDRRVPAAHLAAAWVALQRAELARSRHELGRARAALDECPDAVMAGLLALLAAQCRLAEEQPRQALDAVTDKVTGLPLWLRHRLALAEAEAYVLLGETTRAKAAMERAGDLNGLSTSVIRARAALRDGEQAAAARIVRGVLAEPGTAPADVRLSALLLDAYLSYQSGDPSRGRRALDRALRLGDHEQLLLPFERSKTWVRPLLRHDPDLARPYPRFLERLHVAVHQDDPDHQVYGRLSAREMDVLRYLSKVMTTQEIAASMYVSVNTVKSHLKSIYRKLGVTRRGDAVRRAKHLSLV